MAFVQFLKKAGIIGLAAFLSIGLAYSYSHGDVGDFLDLQIDGAYPPDELFLLQGDIDTVNVDGLTRLSIVDPFVADIMDANEDEIELIGKEAGQTALFIWDSNGKQTVMINVFNNDLDRVAARIEKLLKTAQLYNVEATVNEREGKVVLTGEVAEANRTDYDKIVIRFDQDVLDLVRKQEREDLIEIDLQITELSETLTKSLGIAWFTGGDAGTSQGDLGGSGLFNPTYAETLPSTDGSIEDFFKIGDFNRTSAMLAQVNALLEEGKARILSNPKLVVVSGEEARFLVGGQVPIRTTTTSDGATSENIEFKDFGVGMTITPAIKNDMVDILLNAEISDIDRANAVGDTVAFTTRSASTRLLLEDGQTVVLAGLIRSTESETVKKVPFAAKIPILGALFRHRFTPAPNEEQEIVIALTPNILRHHRPRNSLARVNLEEAMETTGTKKEAKTIQANTVKPYYSGIPMEMKDYVRSLQRRIAESIIYPEEAKDYGWEGTVKVGVLILNDGTLAFATVKESSGYDIFDEVAVATTKRIAPFSMFPPSTDLQELNVTIPIVYSLQNRR